MSLCQKLNSFFELTPTNIFIKQILSFNIILKVIVFFSIIYNCLWAWKENVIDLNFLLITYISYVYWLHTLLTFTDYMHLLRLLITCTSYVYWLHAPLTFTKYVLKPTMFIFLHVSWFLNVLGTIGEDLEISRLNRCLINTRYNILIFKC